MRRSWFVRRWETFSLVLSQQGGEAEGSLIRVVPGRVGAALTKPVSTTREN
jgi:hypothetical protein